jgi:hypothetical protein
MSRYAQQVAVQDYLRAVSADSLFVWGRNVEFYYLADLPPPVRLVHLWAHYMRRFEREPAFFRAEILDPLTAAPPAYILVNRHDTSVRFFDGLDPFLAAGYRQAADFDGVVLYARRVPVDAPDGTDIQ